MKQYCVALHTMYSSQCSSCLLGDFLLDLASRYIIQFWNCAFTELLDLIRDILDVLHVRNHSANRKWTIDDIPGGIPHLCGDIQSSIEAWSQDSGTTKPRCRSCQGEMLVGFRRDRRRCILDTYRFSKCEDVCQSNLHAALMFAHV